MVCHGRTHVMLSFKDNHANTQISQRLKYFNFHETCLMYSEIFRLFRNKVISQAS